MKLCSDTCKPCCDFCKFSMHERIPYEGKMYNGEPIGCFKHPDPEHQEIAKSCGHCEDFQCMNC